MKQFVFVIEINAFLGLRTANPIWPEDPLGLMRCGLASQVYILIYFTSFGLYNFSYQHFARRKLTPLR